jgi:hypothetical protein
VCDVYYVPPKSGLSTHDPIRNTSGRLSDEKDDSFICADSVCASYLNENGAIRVAMVGRGMVL